MGKIAAAVVVVVVVGLVALLSWGAGQYHDEVCQRLQGDAVIVDKLGPLSSCDDRLFSSDIADEDTFIFEIEGPKGKGMVYVKSTSTGPAAAEEFQGILLVVNGEETLIAGTRPPTR